MAAGGDDLLCGGAGARLLLAGAAARATEPHRDARGLAGRGVPCCLSGRAHGRDRRSYPDDGASLGVATGFSDHRFFSGLLAEVQDAVARGLHLSVSVSSDLRSLHRRAIGRALVAATADQLDIRTRHADFFGIRSAAPELCRQPVVPGAGAEAEEQVAQAVADARARSD